MTFSDVSADLTDEYCCPPWKTLFTALFISLSGSFHFGYQIGIVNPTEDVFEEFLNSSYRHHYGVPLNEEAIRFLWSGIVALLMVGAIISSFFLSTVSETLGRCKSLYLTSTLFVIGSLLSASSYYIHAFELLAAGRFVFGFGIGLVMGIQPLYFTEIAPLSHRGLLNNLTAVAAELGFAFSSIIGLPSVLGTKIYWPYLFWLEMVVPLLLIGTLWVFPESPKFLMAQGDTAAALKSIQFFNGDANPKAVLREIEEELTYEQEVTSLGFWELCTTKPVIRKAMFLGCVATFVDPMSGEIVLDHYSTHLLEESGYTRIEAGYANAVICCSILIPVIISGFIVDQIGRRPLLLVSSVLTAFVDLLIMTFLLLHEKTEFSWASEGILFSSILFMQVFGLGPAAIQWYLTAEMVPQNARSSAQAATLFCNYVGTLIAGFVFLPLEGAVGPYSFLMFVFPLLAASVYFYFWLPETKGKTVEEILEQIEQNSKKK